MMDEFEKYFLLWDEKGNEKVKKQILTYITNK